MYDRDAGEAIDPRDPISFLASEVERLARDLRRAINRASSAGASPAALLLEGQRLASQLERWGRACDPDYCRGDR